MDENTKVVIGGKEYELVLTTLATKEISKRYGGLENLGSKLQNAQSFEESIDEIIFLIVLLANQSIMVSNLSSETKKPLLKVEEVELLTTPSDLASFKDAITNAMLKGTKREIVSEEVKNVEGE